MCINYTYSKRCNIAELYHCYQVRVKYSHQEFKEGIKDYEIPNDKWIDLERLERLEINGTIEERVRDIFLYSYSKKMTYVRYRLGL